MWWLALLACSPDDAGTASDPEPYFSETYADLARWICHPEVDSDPCDADLDLTEVHADGSLTVVPHVTAADPIADCLYIYPTTSLDPTDNADWEPGPEEPFVAGLQAARYGAACRLFAPLYRQVTVPALFEGRGDFELAYADVLDAFQHWLAQDVGDRPFLLIGHSQGSGHLERLLAEHIEPDSALHERLIAAHLIGGFVTVPEGADVGGSFAHTPVCTTADQTGCAVHYNAYRETDPPGADAVFGRADPGEAVVCANPAALGGGRAALSGALPLSSPPEVAVLLGPQPGPFADPALEDQLTTDWFSTPGLVEASCVDSDGASVLSVAIVPDPADPRADDIGGDLLPGWGLHLVDVGLAQRDLVQLAQDQISAW